MSWGVEMEPGAFESFGCFSKCNNFARRLSQRRNKPILVNYRGAKNPGNRDITRTDFLMHPNGHREPEVDPTWYTHGSTTAG